MEMTMIALNKEFPIEMPAGLTNGGTFDFIEGLGLTNRQFFFNMSAKEKQLLQTKKVSVRLLHEGDFTLALLRVGNSPLMFELVFDPTIYGDDRAVDHLKRSNMIYIFGIESATNTVETMRPANLPKKLHETWLKVWEKALVSDGYSEKYQAWVQDIYQRYSTERLWDMAVYVGKLGE
ncbi:hypothetical protein [Niallia taxi]|uniref:hypothetical protein n=1 Tax=Niallia taxi TaxID=2499688 RepID=UPI0015F60256|nr:hypothetical protein [Niallia taxi]